MPTPALRGFRLLWAAAVLVPLLGVVGAGLLSWSDIRRDADARMQHHVEMLAQHARSIFAVQEAILTAVIRRIEGQGWGEIRGSEELHGMLAALVASADPMVSAVLVTDAEDRLASASFAYPAPMQDLSARDELQAFRAGAAGPLLGYQPIRLADDRAGFTLARRRPAGGAVLAVIRPAAFAAFQSVSVESPQDMAALIREDGVVLARHPAREEPDGAASPLFLAAFPSRPATGVTTQRMTDGVERRVMLREIPGYPASIAYGLSVSAMRAAWRQRMLAPAAGGLAAAGLLLGLTALAQRGARRAQEFAERRMEAEAQLARAGRAAAIGLLAGGLAHDIKNLVQAVQSGARLMQRRAAEPEEVRRCAALLSDTADRGKRLVDSMLGFARGQAEELSSQVLDVSASLRDLAALLDRTLGSRWHVEVVLPPGLPMARSDRSGFEAAVVNLAANARDAMPQGGVVTIAAWVEELSHPSDTDDLRAGRYVVAAVTDTGSGMDEATLARLGEPFFTTKPPGQGTGLGLATVRGFATRSGGALRFDSAPGRGTTAAIWLPALA